LRRNAFPVTGTTATRVDDLVYQYTGNRLNQVIENAMNDTGYEGGNNIIDYDLNGNMVNMKDKGINSILYNYLNLPNTYSIIQGDPVLGVTSSVALKYLYRADGVKLRKNNTTISGRGQTPTTVTTDYLDGFQYETTEGGGICLTCRTETAYEEQAYKNRGLIPPGGIATTRLDIVPTAEGFYSFTENRYIYQYKDHLGNTRVSFAKNSAGALEVTDINNYYPFGLNHITVGGTNSLLGGYYSYKYNGKEIQETGFYDYGARMYMPDLGRWGVIDEKAEKYRRWSPYTYAIDNPINYIDPDGRDIIFVQIVNQNTQVHLRYNKGNFYYLNGDKKGEKYDGRKDKVSQNLFRLARAYRKIEHSNSKILKGMLHQLENSENKHYILDPQTPNQGSGVQGTSDGGSQTIFNLSSKEEKERFQKMEGVPNSDLSTVAHEMQHQYDKDTDNQSDGTNKSDAQNPLEQRAVKTENEARKIEELPARTTYGGVPVNPNPPNYNVPKDDKEKK
ncbi:RHS repeat-associated core domain-containing protein, partial [Chryseobacterium sp.]|uniref:RHS repeat-associated core domain-containing protein n=1 Tax=Chryseobacterium sp. TaxID=1871047 RepID=UPI0025BAEE38